MTKHGACICWNTSSGQCCCAFFPSLLWWAFFSAYIQPNPLQLPSFRVGKRRPVTDSVGRVARLVLIKHKYLLRVWAWSTFMKWRVTFPYWHLHPMPHCERLMPQIQLSLHFANKGRQLQCRFFFFFNKKKKKYHFCFHPSKISTAF